MASSRLGIPGQRCLGLVHHRVEDPQALVHVQTRVLAAAQHLECGSGGSVESIPDEGHHHFRMVSCLGDLFFSEDDKRKGRPRRRRRKGRSRVKSAEREERRTMTNKECQLNFVRASDFCPKDVKVLSLIVGWTGGPYLGMNSWKAEILLFAGISCPT